LKIGFHYDIEKFRLAESKRIKSIGYKIIKDSGRNTGKIDVIFTSDTELLKINVEFLKHNYLTDIITFDYCEGSMVCGEIYISAERVKENARLNDTSIRSEIRRVIFHGILHLCGYNDATNQERADMRAMEDKYLKLSEGK